MIRKKKYRQQMKQKKSPIIHYKIWMFVNILKIYFIIFLKGHNDLIYYQSENLNENMIIT
jgi:hypothetical protein